MSESTTVESMQWWTSEHGRKLAYAGRAQEIVAWVHANGGEAELVPVLTDNGPQPRIEIRTSMGYVYCAPGQRVVIGEWFEVPWKARAWPPTVHRLREFTVTD